jgi:hypothetical protein
LRGSAFATEEEVNESKKAKIDITIRRIPPAS